MNKPQGCPRFVLFDVGKVLLNYEMNLLNEPLSRLFGLSADQVKNLIAHRDPVHQEYERGRATCAQYFSHVDVLMRKHGGNPRGPWSEEIFYGHWVAVLTGPIPSTTALLKTLRTHLVVCSASNVSPKHYQHGFATWGRDIHHHFDRDIPSFDLGARKGDPDYFERLLAALHAESEECVFIDDLPTNVLAAEFHGIRSVLFSGPDDPDHLVKLQRDLCNHGVPGHYFRPREPRMILHPA